MDMYQNHYTRSVTWSQSTRSPTIWISLLFFSFTDGPLLSSEMRNADVLSSFSFVYLHEDGIFLSFYTLLLLFSLRKPFRNRDEGTEKCDRDSFIEMNHGPRWFRMANEHNKKLINNKIHDIVSYERDGKGLVCSWFSR